jgi:hypothetical protein
MSSYGRFVRPSFVRQEQLHREIFAARSGRLVERAHATIANKYPAQTGTKCVD